MSPTLAEKKRYARNCIVKAYLEWEHYKIAPTDGCFDERRGECKLRTRRYPSRPKSPRDWEANDITLWDACKREEMFETTGNRKDVLKFGEEIKDYIDRFVTDSDIQKYALPDSPSVFWK